MINKMFSFKQLNKGFTLIELLVVIAIIGILATVVTVNYNHAKIISRDSKRKADLENIASAITIYYAENKEYPPISEASDWDDLGTYLQGKDVISTWPFDPKEPEYQYGYSCGVVTDESKCSDWFVVYGPLENSDKNQQPLLKDVGSYSENITQGSGIYLDSATGKYYYRVVGK